MREDIVRHFIGERDLIFSLRPQIKYTKRYVNYVLDQLEHDRIISNFGYALNSKKIILTVAEFAEPRNKIIILFTKPYTINSRVYTFLDIYIGNILDTLEACGSITHDDYKNNPGRVEKVIVHQIKIDQILAREQKEFERKKRPNNVSGLASSFSASTQGITEKYIQSPGKFDGVGLLWLVSMVLNAALSEKYVGLKNNPLFRHHITSLNTIINLNIFEEISTKLNLICREASILESKVVDKQKYVAFLKMAHALLNIPRLYRYADVCGLLGFYHYQNHEALDFQSFIEALKKYDEAFLLIILPKHVLTLYVEKIEGDHYKFIFFDAQAQYRSSTVFSYYLKNKEPDNFKKSFIRWMQYAGEVFLAEYFLEPTPPQFHRNSFMVFMIFSIEKMLAYAGQILVKRPSNEQENICQRTQPCQIIGVRTPYIQLSEDYHARLKHIWFYAVENGMLEIVQFITSQINFNINEVNYQGFKALHLAVLYKRLELVKFFLTEENIDPNDAVVGGFSPLALAVLMNDPLMVQVFLDSQPVGPCARRRIVDFDWMVLCNIKVLKPATLRCTAEICMDALNNNQAQLNKDGEYVTVIRLAALWNHWEIVKLLMNSSQFQPNDKDIEIIFNCANDDFLRVLKRNDRDMKIMYERCLRIKRKQQLAQLYRSLTSEIKIYISSYKNSREIKPAQFFLERVDTLSAWAIYKSSPIPDARENRICSTTVGLSRLEFRVLFSIIDFCDASDDYFGVDVSDKNNDDSLFAEISSSNNLGEKIRAPGNILTRHLSSTKTHFFRAHYEIDISEKSCFMHMMRALHHFYCEFERSGFISEIIKLFFDKIAGNLKIVFNQKTRSGNHDNLYYRDGLKKAIIAVRATLEEAQQKSETCGHSLISFQHYKK